MGNSSHARKILEETSKQIFQLLLPFLTPEKRETESTKNEKRREKKSPKLQKHNVYKLRNFLKTLNKLYKAPLLST